MPSDLNLKKSWNPKLLKNREKVWKKEREIYDEYKKGQQRTAKFNEINEKNELLALANNENGKLGKKNEKTSWMYQSPVSYDKDESVNEDVLLGKRKLNDAITDNNKSKKTVDKLEKILQTGNANDESPKANDLGREKLSKSDPLYAIKLQQIKRAEMLEKQRKIEQYQKRERGNDRHNTHTGDRHNRIHKSHSSHRNHSRTIYSDNNSKTNRSEKKIG